MIATMVVAGAVSAGLLFVGYGLLWLVGLLALAIGYGGQWLIDRRKDDS